MGGGFSESGFSNIGFNTGPLDEETYASPDQDFRHYHKVMREDEEILEFIITTVTSGLL